MIESRISNELTLKRYKKFKKDRVAVFSVWALLFLFFLSFTAEWWASNKPHFMYYQGQFYAPLVKDYHPTLFDRTDIFVMDYRSLQLGDKDWAVWPLVLLGAVVLAILAIGVVAGWPLMVAAVGVERGDSFQAISTSFSYLYQRPLHYAFYSLVALAVAVPAIAVASLFADATGTLAMLATTHSQPGVCGM
jgi:ABC-type antimicrobial peptide transport system permease subunit